MRNAKCFVFKQKDTIENNINIIIQRISEQKCMMIDEWFKIILILITDTAGFRINGNVIKSIACIPELVSWMFGWYMVVISGWWVIMTWLSLFSYDAYIWSSFTRTKHDRKIFSVWRHVARDFKLLLSERCWDLREGRLHACGEHCECSKQPGP
jgi:hypothetical protein